MSIECDGGLDFQMTRDQEEPLYRGVDHTRSHSDPTPEGHEAGNPPLPSPIGEVLGVYRQVPFPGQLPGSRPVRQLGLLLSANLLFTGK